MTFLAIFVRKRWHQKLERTQRIIKYLHQNESLLELNRDGYLGIREQLTIGDTSCLYNAKSPYLRCAIAPESACDNCPHYEKI